MPNDFWALKLFFKIYQTLKYAKFEVNVGF
jgi:hypothetical protein